jgi:hypothetical protein
VFEELLKLQCFVVFGPLGDSCGKCNLETRRITIDLRENISPVKIFLHELIHLLNPHWTEGQVCWWENYIWNTRSHVEIEELYKKLFRDSAKRSAW